MGHTKTHTGPHRKRSRLDRFKGQITKLFEDEEDEEEAGGLLGVLGTANKKKTGFSLIKKLFGR